MIVACYAVANEAQLIAESLRSVKAYVDRFVIVDSVFTTNPIDATHSTDLTRITCEVVCDPVPLTYIESDRKLRQEEARNRYLQELDDGDWAIVVDGDEVLYADHAEAVQTFGWLLHGEHDIIALDIPVLTAAVMFEGMAAEMPAPTYKLAPVIHTRGYAPRVFRKTPNTRYKAVVYPNGVLDNMGVWDGNRPLQNHAIRDTRLTIINHHVRQDFAGYQADAVWETLNLIPEAV